MNGIGPGDSNSRSKLACWKGVGGAPDANRSRMSSGGVVSPVPSPLASCGSGLGHWHGGFAETETVHAATSGPCSEPGRGAVCLVLWEFSLSSFATSWDWGKGFETCTASGVDIMVEVWEQGGKTLGDISCMRWEQQVRTVEIVAASQLLFFCLFLCSLLFVFSLTHQTDIPNHANVVCGTSVALSHLCPWGSPSCNVLVRSISVELLLVVSGQ